MICDYSSAYENAAKALLSGNPDAAQLALEAIPNWLAEPNAARSSRNLSYTLQAATFLRDHFTCRYCARRTVFVPVLRLLSMAFKDSFPYHPHGLMTSCHLAFWRDVASCDHVVPIARLGTSLADNLATACYQCNSMKQNFLAEELGWTLQPIPEERSMGWLIGHVPSTVGVSGETK